MGKITNGLYGQKHDNQNMAVTKSLGKVMGDQDPAETKHDSPMSLEALLHQGSERKHPNEAHRSAGSLINHG